MRKINCYICDNDDCRKVIWYVGNEPDYAVMEREHFCNLECRRRARVKEIKCPDCKGTGRVRDWIETVFTIGLSLLFNADKCERCSGAGTILVILRKEGA